MAQKAAFVDQRHYAIGRWDGSIGIFAFADAPFQKPVVARMVANPTLEGIQMIVPLEMSHSAFISSGDTTNMIVWASESGNWTDLRPASHLNYDRELGAANSGALLSLTDGHFLIVGHANGFVTIWKQGSSFLHWKRIATTDVRSKAPVNPWKLFNVRGVAVLATRESYGVVVAGSEDGNLTTLHVPDGSILSTAVYNPKAQRGINSLAAHDTALLVANCSVGPEDFNLWSYHVDQESWHIEVRDRANLCLQPTAPQVFNFDVVFAAYEQDGLWFFSSTEEGALWMGRVSGSGRIDLEGHRYTGPALGSALCFQDGRLAVTSYDLHEFVVGWEAAAE
jgi:hypothetical protein